MKIFQIGKKILFPIVMVVLFLSLSIVSFASSDFVVTKSDEAGPSNSKIVGFDVYHNLIAIGLKDHRILFFDEKGKFLYRWNFEVTANYNFFFDSTGYLNIVSSRSGNCYTIDCNNTVADVKKNYLHGGMYNNIHKEGMSPKEIGDSRIEYKNHSVILIDPDGRELVVYEADPFVISGQRFFLWVGLPVFLIIFFIALVKQERARKLRGKGGNGTE